jgi:hypothetical protein
MKILSIIYAGLLYVMLYAVLVMPRNEAVAAIKANPFQTMGTSEEIAPAVKEESFTVAHHPSYDPYLHSEEFKQFWELHMKKPVKMSDVLDCRDWKHSDLISLACNIYHEGRGESLEGQIAIINVTLNRVNAGEYLDSIAGVVWERVRGIPQFSWTSKYKNQKVRNETAWERSMMLARFAIDGEIVDITNGSLYYHVTTLDNDNVDWFKTALNHRIDIGRHSFYGI